MGEEAEKLPIGEYVIAIIGDKNIGICDIMSTLQLVKYPTNPVDYGSTIKLHYPPKPVCMECTIRDVSGEDQAERLEFYKQCDEIHFAFSCASKTSLSHIETMYLPEARSVIPENLPIYLVAIGHELYNGIPDDGERSKTGVECIPMKTIRTFVHRNSLQHSTLGCSYISLSYHRNLCFFTPKPSWDHYLIGAGLFVNQLSSLFTLLSHPQDSKIDLQKMQKFSSKDFNFQWEGILHHIKAYHVDKPGDVIDSGPTCLIVSFNFNDVGSMNTCKSIINDFKQYQGCPNIPVLLVGFPLPYSRASHGGSIIDPHASSNSGLASLKIANSISEVIEKNKPAQAVVLEEDFFDKPNPRETEGFKFFMDAMTRLSFGYSKVKKVKITGKKSH